MATHIKACFVLVLASLLPLSAAAGAPDHATQGRDITAAFGAELRTALQAAMAEGGPLAAIEVCSERAPRIAAAAGQRAGASVGRTSLRLRNPDNQPDEHERTVLEAFAAALAEDPAAPPPEHIATLADGRVRYMSAIVMQPPCLACHGEVLEAAVAEAIDARYPRDEARGYRVGDLRGAFTITWPAD